MKNKNRNKKQMNTVWKTLLRIISAGLTLICLCGCGKQKAHYEEVRRKAEKYFKEKYGEKAEVVDSIVAGNNGLFGYLGVDDRAYEMSDGTMVYWNDKEEYFADNKQAEEIAAALTNKVVEPALAAMDPDSRVSEYSFNRTNMDSFDEMVYREYFDGNLEEFAGKEEIRLQDFEALVHESAYREGVEGFFDSISRYLKGYGGRVVVLREDTGEDPPFELGVNWPEGDRRVRAVAYQESEGGVSWLENTYVEVLPGVKMMSALRNFVLEPGDLTFVEAGTAGDLQKMLDEAYYAMPVDAKENEKGGYSVRDRRHESRAVLTDPEAVIWRVQFSERLRDEIEKGDFRNSFYVLTDDPENTQLWSYLVKDDRYRFCVWKVTDDSVLRGAYKSFSEGDLFYPGGVTYEKLGE